MNHRNGRRRFPRPAGIRERDSGSRLPCPERRRFAVVINEGERAGRVQAPGSLDRGGRREVLPFFHVRALEEGNGDGQQEKRMPKTGTITVKPPPMVVLVMMRSNHSVVFATWKRSGTGLGFLGGAGEGGFGAHDGRRRRGSWGQDSGGRPQSCPGMC